MEVELKLNAKQSKCIELAHEGKNLFITGSGGVGKSVVIRELVETLDDCLLLAPTGIAAVNIGGSTLHKTFGLPFGIALKGDETNITSSTKELFEDGKVKTIIIDEISMVRTDYFTTIDRKLKRLLKNYSRPFGGIQIIVVGDFFQLPPVLTPKDEEFYHMRFESVYAFGCQLWNDCMFTNIELDQVMRQDDEKTIQALNHLRKGNRDPRLLKWFNDRCNNNQPPESAVCLCTTNKKAAEINHHFFQRIESDAVTFRGCVEGKYPKGEMPVDDIITLKVGCRVVLCANDWGAGYTNGQCGVVKQLAAGQVVVTIDDGEDVIVVPKEWESYTYKAKGGEITKDTDGKFKQLPIKLGWGITIHKSQGMTLDGCVLDLGWGAFCHGQTYVAMSRIRSLDHMVLMRDIEPKDLIVDQVVIDFYKGLVKV
jgi:hypothetical protein